MRRFIKRDILQDASDEQLVKIKVSDQKIHVNHKRVDVGFASEKLKGTGNLSHSTLGEDVGKVSSNLFPCSAFVMSKSSQDGLWSLCPATDTSPRVRERSLPPNLE